MFKKGIMKVKKDLAVILSAAMVLSSFSVPVMAAEDLIEDVEEVVAIEEVTEEAEEVAALAEEEVAEEEVAAEAEDEEELGEAEVKDEAVYEDSASSNTVKFEVSGNVIREVSVISGNTVSASDIPEEADVEAAAKNIGYKFMGTWSNGVSANLTAAAITSISINAATTFTADIEKLAEDVVAAKRSKITVEIAPADAGKVEYSDTVSDDKTAEVSADVILTFTANKGYKFVKAESADVTLVPKNGGKVSFTVPAKDVTVKATFEKTVSDNTPSGNTPSGNTPGGGNTPSGNTPGGDTPSGNTPGGDTTTYFPGDEAALKAITGKAVLDFDTDVTDDMIQAADGKTLAKYRTLFADGQFAIFPKRDQKDDADVKTTTKISSTIVSRLNDAGTEMMFTGSTEKHKRVFSTGGGWYLNGKKRVSAAINFKTAKPATVKVYWGSNDAAASYLGVFSASAMKDSDVEKNSDTLAIDKDQAEGKTSGTISTFKLTEAGEYYLGGYKVDNQGKNVQIYKVEVTCEGYVEPEKDETSSGNKAEGAKSDEEIAKDYAALAAAVGAKGEANLKDVRGGADDQVGFDITVAKGKVKTVNLASIADGTQGRATINAKVKLGGLSGYTITTSSNDIKVQKAAEKVQKGASRKGVAVLKAVKTSPVYVLTLTNASKNIKVDLYVVNVSLDKKSIKGLALTTATVSTDAVSKNRVDISKTFGAVNGNTATIGTTPADERFVSGVWMIGKTAISKVGEPVSVTSGKLSVTAIVNADGTITVAPAGGKGTIKFVYMLNGKKYTAAIKVK